MVDAAPRRRRRAQGRADRGRAPLPEARAPALRAAKWLLANRPYPAGWGYNRRSGADADSTAHALLLLSAAGFDADPADVDFIEAHARPDGGFATFQGPGSWGASHADVTPAATLALPRARREARRAAVLHHVERARLPDGSWPAYWWRTHHYSTYWNVRLRRALGVPVRCPLRVHDGETHAVRSAFDLAHVIALAALVGLPQVTRIALGDELVGLQTEEGGFPGDLNLRVTDPGCAAPWIAPAGRLYCDIHGIITTASAVRALTCLVK
jgi:hypothetical protein